MSALRLTVSEAARIKLSAGQRVLLSGVIYTARDMAHARLTDALERGEPLPVPLEAIYYSGPAPAPPGRVIGSCGPTTSARMDRFTPALLNAGLRVMIGKGNRNEAVRRAIVENGAVYLCAVGGAGALIAQCVKQAREVAYPELGCESIKALTVEDMPLLVAIDSSGASLFKS